MSAPLTITQAADLTDLAIQKVFMKTSEPEAQYKKYFNFRTTTDLYEKDSSLSGLSEADFVDENGIVAVDIPVQGYDKTYTQNQVDHMVSFSKKVWRFGISKRKLNNAAKELKASVNRKKEKLCAERLTNGFDSTSYSHTGSAKTTTITTSGGDGIGAFDNSHTSESGSSNINNVVYDGRLNVGFAV